MIMRDFFESVDNSLESRSKTEAKQKIIQARQKAVAKSKKEADERFIFDMERSRRVAPADINISIDADADTGIPLTPDTQQLTPEQEDTITSEMKRIQEQIRAQKQAREALARARLSSIVVPMPASVPKPVKESKCCVILGGYQYYTSLWYAHCY